MLLPGYDPFAESAGFVFLPRLAALACDFFSEMLKHVEGDQAGKPLELAPWQRSIVANLWGWRDSDGWRRYRECLLYVPRKNGKSTLAAGLALLCTVVDREIGAQNYLAASDRDQATLIFRIAAGMVEQEPELAQRLRVYSGTGQRTISYDELRSFIKVLSADAPGKHGLNPHLVLVDELHAQPNRDLVDVLRTGSASTARRQPLLMVITTADFDRPSICNETLDYATKVRDGVVPDARFLPAVWRAEQSDDWTEEATWSKANPNLGVSVSLDYLRRECKRAQEVPAYENTFRRLHLNQVTEQAVRFIPLAAWDTCAGESIRWEDVRGSSVFVGLDLSSTTDTTAAAALWRDGELWRLAVRVWIPSDSAEERERRDRVPYLAWEKAGWIVRTPGNVVDYQRVRMDLEALAGVADLRMLAVDPWNSRQLTGELMSSGIPVTEVRQGFATLNEPTKELLRLIVSGKLRHGANPVLRWMAANVAAETDAAGNVKLAKDKSTGRIDGVSATVNALAVAQREIASVYETRGVITIE